MPQNTENDFIQWQRTERLARPFVTQLSKLDVMGCIKDDKRIVIKRAETDNKPETAVA